MTIEDVNSRNFTYCQAFYSTGPSCRLFIVDTFRTKEAKEKADEFAINKWGKPNKIYLYPRNYIREARKLFNEGLCN